LGSARRRFQVVTIGTGSCGVASTPIGGGPSTVLSPAYPSMDGACYINAVTFDETNVYYAASLYPSGVPVGIVVRVPITPGPALTLVSLESDGAAEIAVDSKHLFFSDTYTLYSVPR
jgi:hypothetical protein